VPGGRCVSVGASWFSDEHMAPMRDSCDVAIVGAGPGGSAAGYYLGRRGLEVVLLDKSEFPRDKT